MPVSLGIPDFLVLAVIVLFMVIGYKKGLVTMVTALVSTLGAYLAAFVLARPIAAALADAGGVFGKVREGIRAFFLHRADDIGQSIGESIEALHLPGFLEKPLAGQLDLTSPLTEGADQLAQTAFRLLLTGVAAILVFVGVLILFRLVSGVLNAFFSKIGFLNAANRSLGLIAGLINGILVVLVVMAILGLFAPMAPKLSETLKASVIARYFYDFNLFLSMLAKLASWAA